MNIFVFGSNLKGIHGRGSAAEALAKHGAIYGRGVGLQGNSYAIPTKDRNLKVLSLPEIRIYVDQFIQFAKDHPEMTFHVVKVGCGLAGYRDYDIAPMFRYAPENVVLHPDWVRLNEEMYGKVEK
jgi:hypothetical protein